ncbi:MAG: 23S rRNA (pseudouridine(1915)-N(3))-methyltransferase RlmH [Acholeplasma sp.]|nr:23S rRNA (pseudouridine(1915)-N(3))-methyltransferase RlmH [Acholeplasma sp.]
MIKIISVGKLKNKDIESLYQYYLKQIPRKIEVVEIKDEPTISGIYKEGQSILKKVNDDDIVVTLEILGTMYSSEDFATLIEKIENASKKDIVFVIGGSYGLDEEVKKRSDYQISFSKMTFPHQLMKVLVCEQIFRAYSILNNHPYHK